MIRLHQGNGDIAEEDETSCIASFDPGNPDHPSVAQGDGWTSFFLSFFLSFFGDDMYSWQILTLARVERLVKPDYCDKPCLMGKVKEVLYQLGQSHFPIPTVFVDPPEAAKGFKAILRWEVDDRTMELRFDTINARSLVAFGWTNRLLTFMDGFFCHDQESIIKRSDWLLLGTEIK